MRNMKCVLGLISAVVLATAGVSTAEPWSWSTLAGAVTSGSLDGPGQAARFHLPQGVAAHPDGSVLVSDTENHVIRRIAKQSEQWTVATIAGIPGVSGAEDGPGAQARFNNPAGIAVSTNGIAYVADEANNTIRKLVFSGGEWVVTTLAGSPGVRRIANGGGTNAGFFFPFSVAINPQGNLYVAERGNSYLRQITPSGQVTTTRMGGTIPPEIGGGVTVDRQGNIFVGSGSPFPTIVKYTPGGLKQTWAGSVYGNMDGYGPSAQFLSPAGLATDAEGNIYVADPGTQSIRRIDANRYVTTIAGSANEQPGCKDDTNRASLFYEPTAVAVSSNGTVFVADTGNHSIRIVERIGTNWVTTTIAGASGVGNEEGPGAQARFFEPTGVAFDAQGNLYVADSLNSTIRKVDTVGTVTTLAGKPGESGSTDGARLQARFNRPAGVAVAGDGSVYVADTRNHTVRRIAFSQGAAVVETIAGLAGVSGNSNGIGASARFSSPGGIVISAGESLYVCESFAIRQLVRQGTEWQVRTIAGGGSYQSRDGTNTAAGFSWVHSITADTSGSLFVAEGNLIRKISPVGSDWVVTTIADLGSLLGTSPYYRSSWGIAAGGGELYVTDSGWDLVYVLRPEGSEWRVDRVLGAQSGPGTGAFFARPRGIAYAPDGRLAVADSRNQAIRIGQAAPRLRVEWRGDSPVLSWPTWATNYVLELSPEPLPGAVWRVVETTNSAPELPLPIEVDPGGTQFFRLRRR